MQPDSESSFHWRLATRARSAASLVGAPLAVLAAIAFIAQIGIAVMLPLLPLFATELGAQPFVLGLLTSAFALTNGLAQLSAGFVLDRYGSRRFIAGGLGLYAAGNALIATAGSAFSLVFWRAVSGFGGGTLLVAQRVYVAEVTPSERRAFANGVLSAAASAGMVAGPAIGGTIAAWAGLRSVFIVVAATSSLALIAAFFLPRPRRTEAARRRAAEAGAAVRLPLRPVAALLAVNTALFASYGGFITTYAPLATERLAWSTIDIGLAFSMFGMGSILLGPALAHLADRIGRKPVAIAACIPVALFSLALVFAWPRLAIYAVAVIAGGGLTAMGAAWYALLADVTPERIRGRVFGTVSGISSLGIVAGAMLATTLWERVDLETGMLSSAATILLSGALLLAFRPPSGDESPGANERGIVADAAGDARPMSDSA